MQEIKTIYENDAIDFDAEVNNLLKNGYKISSTYCGQFVYRDGGTTAVFQAILLREKPSDGLF